MFTYFDWRLKGYEETIAQSLAFRFEDVNHFEFLPGDPQSETYECISTFGISSISADDDLRLYWKNGSYPGDGRLRWADLDDHHLVWGFENDAMLRIGASAVILSVTDQV